MSKHNYLRHLRDWFPPGLLKTIINLWPPLLAAGIKIKEISPDFRDVKVELKLHWFNKNYVGVQYGGSLYSMTDPFYMLILLKNLGEKYIIWDKAGYIDFKKPGLGTVKAHFKMTEDEIHYIQQQADQKDKYIFDKTVDIFNEEGEVVASVVRTLYVKKKKENFEP
jgi:hypothetical protein